MGLYSAPAGSADDQDLEDLGLRAGDLDADEIKPIGDRAPFPIGQVPLDRSPPIDGHPAASDLAESLGKDRPLDRGNLGPFDADIHRFPGRGIGIRAHEYQAGGRRWSESGTG